MAPHSAAESGTNPSVALAVGLHPRQGRHGGAAACLGVLQRRFQRMDIHVLRGQGEEAQRTCKLTHYYSGEARLGWACGGHRQHTVGRTHGRSDSRQARMPSRWHLGVQTLPCAAPPAAAPAFPPQSLPSAARFHLRTVPVAALFPPLFRGSARAARTGNPTADDDHAPRRTTMPTHTGLAGCALTS
jgi:hypothetical protein